MRLLSCGLVFATVLLVPAFVRIENHFNEDQIERVAGPIGLPDGRYNQQLWWVPIPSPGEARNELLLEAIVYAPSGAGPFPLITINHGKPTPGSDLRLYRPEFEAAAHWFVDHGFVVAVPLRRGYGHSQGVAADMAGTCATMDYVATAKSTAMDIEGVIRFFAKQSVVDKDHIVVVGHSHGAFGAFGLAAEATKGVIGIVNFAGGTGSWKATNAWQLLRQLAQGRICNGRQRLLSALTHLGARNSVPQIWLYAENDEAFGPELAQEMVKSYKEKSRAPILFYSLPASERSGHMAFAKDDVAAWAKTVSGFLEGLRIPGYHSD